MSERDISARLAALGLAATAAGLDDIVALATKKRWSPVQLLEHILSLEEQDRSRRGLDRRLKRSRLKRFKPMADFDWNWPTKIDRSLVKSALRLDFIEDARNIVLVAPQGLGKTTMAQNIVHQAVISGHGALFISAAQLLLDHALVFRTVPLANTLVRWVNENAFASIMQARPCPTLGRPIRHGIAPSTTARYFSSNPSDSTSRWTPCPPQLFRGGFRSTLAVSSFRLRARLGFSIPSSCGRRGITPAFGYGSPHPGTGGTRTLLTSALPGAHYARVGLLVIDEIGFLAFDARNADLLFQVITRRYEKEERRPHDQSCLPRLTHHLSERNLRHRPHRPRRAPCRRHRHRG